MAAKVRTFPEPPKLFVKNFVFFFPSLPPSGMSLGVANLILAPGYPACPIIYGVPFSLESGCKGSASGHTLQIFWRLFSIFFSRGDGVYIMYKEISAARTTFHGVGKRISRGGKGGFVARETAPTRWASRDFVAGVARVARKMAFSTFMCNLIISQKNT